MFDFLKRKELQEIAALKTQLEAANNQISALSRYQELSDLDSERKRIEKEIIELKLSLENETKQQQAVLSSLKDDRDLLDMEIAEKKNQLTELDEHILLQDFGLYTPIFDFTTSEEYKNRLDDIRQEV